MDTLHEDVLTFMKKSHSILLRIGIVSKKIVEKIKTHFTFNNHSPESRAIYEIMWKYMAESGRPQKTI
jgi:hypothetical protein